MLLTRSIPKQSTMEEYNNGESLPNPAHSTPNVCCLSSMYLKYGTAFHSHIYWLFSRLSTRCTKSSISDEFNGRNLADVVCSLNSCWWEGDGRKQKNIVGKSHFLWAARELNLNCFLQVPARSHFLSLSSSLCSFIRMTCGVFKNGLSNFQCYRENVCVLFFAIDFHNFHCCEGERGREAVL